MSRFMMAIESVSSRLWPEDDNRSHRFSRSKLLTPFPGETVEMDGTVGTIGTINIEMVLITGIILNPR